MSGDAMLGASRAGSASAQDEGLFEGPRLICVAGPAKGTEFPLTSDMLDIGRAVENAISIPDTSVSRKHARIVRRGETWVCSDMGSGNGTLLNGNDLRGEKVLRDGDTLTMGDTELSCVLPEPTQSRSLPRSISNEHSLSARSGSARSGSRSGSRSGARSGRSSTQDAASRKRSRRLLLLAALLVVTGLGVFAAVKAQMREREERARQELMAVEAERARLAAIFQKGKNLVREGRWEEARGLFVDVKKAAPDYPTLEQFLQRAEKEIPNEKALNRARQALERDALAEAAAALREVPADTQLFELHQALSTTLGEQVARKLQEAQSQLRGGSTTSSGGPKLQALKTMLQDVVAASPESREAAVLLEEVQARLQAATVLVKPRRVRTPARPWEDAVGLFVDGELDGAMEAAQSCSRAHRRCRDLVEKLESFQLMNKRVDTLDLNGLTRLVDIARSISGGPRSLLARDAETRAGVLLYNRASAAKASGQWSKATDYAKRTLEADPRHAGAKALLQQLHERAKEVYLSAYSLKDAQPEEALKRFREVVQMTPRGDEYNSKASHWIRQLER